MTKEIFLYPELVEKGLTPKEAEILGKFIEEGKPGLTKYKAEKLGEVYVLGYSCAEIHKWFPEYPLAILLHSRLYYDWDGARVKYREVIGQETISAALTARMDSVKFLTEIVTATHVKWRKQLLSYIANPDSNEAPKFVPDNIHNYQTLMALLRDVTSGGEAGKNKEGEALSPLVSVTVNSDKSGKPDIVIGRTAQEAVKDALMREVSLKKDGA